MTTRLRIRRLAGLGAVAAASAFGCATAPIPIPLAGRATELVALVGEWSGEYSGAESHRAGSISFTLRAGDSTAFGEVVMVPAGFDHQVLADQHHVAASRLHPELLTISFAVVANGGVSGLLDPYIAPDCDCLVVTTFTGRLTKPSILEGTFLTRRPGSSWVQTGRWRVERKR